MTNVRLPKNTIRLRLTFAYGGLFLVSGAALLTLTYFLARGQYSSRFFIGQGNAGIAKVLVTQQLQGVNGAVTRQVVGQPAVVTAAASAASDAALHTLLVDSAIALGAMSVLSLWLGWFVAGRALAPLRTITGAAREISAQNLHRRLALTGPDDELKELASTFDDLLARLEASFEAQRRFVANASHELRTPLTLERALVEVALADPDADTESLRQTLRKVLDAGREQEQLIAALLMLSRSQRGLDHYAPIDLREIAGDAVEGIEGAVLVETELGRAETSGDPALVERLVANLVGNAVRHNVDHGWIAVSTSTRGGRAYLSVRNSGPVVPPAELDRLFQPFQRLDGRRDTDRGGLGLGLSIVEAIAAAHGAEVVVGARPDGGLDVEVGFLARIRVRRPAPALAAV